MLDAKGATLKRLMAEAYLDSTRSKAGAKTLSRASSRCIPYVAFELILVWKRRQHERTIDPA